MHVFSQGQNIQSHFNGLFKAPLSVSLTASCDQYDVFIILTLILQPGRGGACGVEEERERGGGGEVEGDGNTAVMCQLHHAAEMFSLTSRTY